MTIYTGTIQRALASIAKKGDVCTWRQWDIQDGDEDWTEDDASTSTDYTVKIVFFPYGAQVSNMSFAQVDGDVERFTSYGLMGSTGGLFTPKLRDLIIRSDGQVMKARGLDVLKPGAEALLYTIGFVG